MAVAACAAVFVLAAAVTLAVTVVSTAVTLAVTVVSAAVTLAMAFAVVTAHNVGVILKGAVNQRVYGFIGRTGNAAVKFAVKFYPHICKGVLGACSYAAADESVHAQILEKSGKSAVAASGCVLNVGIGNFAVLNGINLEIFTVAEMLEHLAVFVGYSYLHLLILRFILNMRRCTRLLSCIS